MTPQTPGHTTETLTQPVAQSAAGEPIGLEELGLAGRNHSMPLEALRYPLTPADLHYLLIHFDIPDVDPATWQLTLDGLVERPLTLSLDDLRARPTVILPVMLECAGNGRALLKPHVVSRPWLNGGVGTAEWTGTPVTRILPRSLMIPPGILEFLTRTRLLATGPSELRGQAWSGEGPVVRVEVSTDGGLTWQDAA